MVCDQRSYDAALKTIDTLIHVGEISGAYMALRPRHVWRVSPDGRLSDQFRALSRVFDMSEEFFFAHYATAGTHLVTRPETSQLERWRSECDAMRAKIPDLPFSNIWMAQQGSRMVPAGSILHFGILNSLRSWNYFAAPAGTIGYSNTGGFGIDGCVSSLIGSALAAPDAIHFGFVGDLAFFYDLNALGNRHTAPNVRILLVNNGCGTEFKLYSHTASQFGDDANDFRAAAGHYGNRSESLVRGFVESLGFEYRSALNKEEFMDAAQEFFSATPGDKPMVLEAFTNPEDESEALRTMRSLAVSAVGAAKDVARSILGDNAISALKKVLRK